MTLRVEQPHRPMRLPSEEGCKGREGTVKDPQNWQARGTDMNERRRRIIITARAACGVSFFVNKIPAMSSDNRDRRETGSLSLVVTVALLHISAVCLGQLSATAGTWAR